MSKRSLFQDSSREILISEVQTRPCLWDDTHPDYKNCEKNKKIWEEIGKVIGMTGNDAKTKWKNLKDKFRRELQKEPIGHSGDAGWEYKSKWPFFNLMMFVKDSLIPSCMSGNLSVGEELQSNTREVTDNESDIDIMSSSFAEVSSPSTSNKFSQSTISKPTRANKKRHIIDDSTQKLLDLEEKKIAILQSAQEREKKTYDDPDAQFLLSFLSYIQQLSTLEKLEVRSQIQSVVLKAYRKKNQKYPSLVQQFHETENNSQEYIQTQVGPSNESEITQIYRPYNEEINVSRSTAKLGMSTAKSAAPSVSDPTHWVPSYTSTVQSNHGSVQSIERNTHAGSTLMGTQCSDISLSTNTNYNQSFLNLNNPY